MAFSRLRTLSNEPRRMRFSVNSANQRSTWFNQDALVGVK
jgi:hypothetical protein